MAQFLNDTFTGANNTALTAHNAEAGGTYVSWYGSVSPIVYTALGGVIGCGAASGINIYRNTVVAPAADVKISATFNWQAVAYNNVGICARLDAAGTAGYLAAHNKTDNKWYIFRLGASGSSITLASSSATPYAVGATPTIDFEVTGSGAAVALSISIGGVVVASYSDVDPARVVAAGYTGVSFNSTGAAGTGMFIGSMTADTIAASGSAVTFTGPAADRIFPLSGGTTGTIGFTFDGTYSGPAPNQWRIVAEGSSASVAGFDWQAFASAPAGNAFSQAVAALPKLNGFYTVQVRNSADAATVFTSNRIGAGALVGLDGQSNAWLFCSPTTWAGDGTLTPHALVRVTGKQASNTWNIPATATMNAAIAFGNALAAVLQCPVGLVDGSWDGSGLVMTGNGGQWIPTSGTTYQQSLAAMNAAGGKLLANVWIQGEGDAGAGITQTAYYNGLTTLIAQRRADLSAPNLPFIVVTLGRNTAGMSDTSRERIKLAQVQKCADANIYRVDRLDLPLHTDGIHHTAAGFTKLGQRCAQAVLASVGAVAQYRGPSIASVAKFSATEFDVVLTHHMGSDFVPTTGSTGWAATDPGASNAVIAVTGAARQAANKVRLTLASAPVGLPSIGYLVGSAPVVTGVVSDNSALALPLEYNAGVVAGASAAPSITRTVSVTLGDASGACANLSGLMVGLRLGIGPHNSGAALYQSGTETTNASGVLDFSFDSEAISAGQSGLLEVLMPDGRHFLGIVAVA